MVRGVVILACLLSATFSSANAKTLSGPAIKHLVSGATMYINTPLNTKIPVHYSQDGTLSGVAGSMGFYLGAAKDTGRWWVSRERLCHKWRRWFDGDAQCLTLSKRGNIVHWASQNGRTGSAQIQRSKPRKPSVVVAETKASPKVTRALPQAVSEKQSAATIKTTNTFAVAAVAPMTVPKKTDSVAKVGSSRKRAAAHRKVKPLKKSARVQANTGVAKAQTAKTKTKPKAISVATHSSQGVKYQKQSLGARQTSWQKISSFRVAHVSEVDMLNIRKGPSEYHSVVGRIAPTARGVKIVGICQQWWCPVVHGRVSGWVNRFYLTAER